MEMSIGKPTSAYEDSSEQCDDSEDSEADDVSHQDDNMPGPTCQTSNPIRPGGCLRKRHYTQRESKVGFNRYVEAMIRDPPSISKSIEEGVYHAQAKSGPSVAEVKGPNSSAEYKASLSCLSTEASAQVFSASATNGPGKASISMGARASIGASCAGIVDMIDTFDRPAEAFAGGTFACAGSFAHAFKNEPGMRIPAAGVYAKAGVGYARAEWSVFDAEAKGPNASAGAGVSASSLSAKAFVSLELASASANAGPVRVTAGLSAETGISVGPSGVAFKILGIGLAIGQKMEISLFGSGIRVNL